MFSDGMLVDFGSSGSSDSSDSSNIFDSSGSCGSDSIGSSSSNAFSSVDSIKFFDDSGGSTAPTPLEPPSSKRAQCAETLSLQSSDDGRGRVVTDDMAARADPPSLHALALRPHRSH